MDEIPEDVPRTPAGIAAWARAHGRTVSEVLGGRTLRQLFESLRAVDGDQTAAATLTETQESQQVPAGASVTAAPAPAPAAPAPAPAPAPATAATMAPMQSTSEAAPAASAGPASSVPPLSFGQEDEREESVRSPLPQTFETLVGGTPERERARLPRFPEAGAAAAASVRRPKRRRRAGQQEDAGAVAQAPPTGAQSGAGHGARGATPSVLAPPGQRLQQLRELCASRQQRSSWLRLQLMAMELGVISEESSKAWSRVELCRALARKLGADPEDVQVHAQLYTDGAELYAAADLDEYRDVVMHHAWKNPRLLVPKKNMAADVTYLSEDVQPAADRAAGISGVAVPALAPSGVVDLVAPSVISTVPSGGVARILDHDTLSGMLESGRTLKDPLTRERVSALPDVDLPQVRQLQQRLMLERTGVSMDEATHSSAAASDDVAAGANAAAGGAAAASPPTAARAGTTAAPPTPAAAAASAGAAAAGAAGAAASPTARQHDREMSRKAARTVNHIMNSVGEISKKQARGRTREDAAVVASNARLVLMSALAMVESGRVNSSSAKELIPPAGTSSSAALRASSQGELWRQALVMAKSFDAKLRRRTMTAVLNRLRKDPTNADFSKWSDDLRAAWTDWQKDLAERRRHRRSV